MFSGTCDTCVCVCVTCFKNSADRGMNRGMKVRRLTGNIGRSSFTGLIGQQGKTNSLGVDGCQTSEM